VAYCITIKHRSYIQSCSQCNNRNYVDPNSSSRTQHKVSKVARMWCDNIGAKYLSVNQVSMLIQNTSKYITTLFENKYLGNCWRSTLFLQEIKLLMDSPKHYLQDN
jgi:hypothetical protein